MSGKQAVAAWLALFTFFYFIGSYARNQRAFSYLHEYGHVIMANQYGIQVTSVTRYLTTFNIGRLPYSVWVGGFWMEMIVWSGLAVAFTFAKWKGIGGLLAGFCFGFQNRVYIVAQYPNIDFNSAGKFALVQWRFWGSLIIGGLYLILIRRLWIWWREARRGSGDHHSKVEQHADSEQGSGTDLRKADSGLDSGSTEEVQEDRPDYSCHTG